MTIRFGTCIVLAAAIALPMQAAQADSTRKASMAVSIVALSVPFSVAYLSAAGIANSHEASVGASRHWRVASVQEKGDKTALELHSDDPKMKLEMAVDTKIAQAQQVKVGDAIEIEAVGKTGHVVRKGKTTIALLAEPGNGTVHSKART